MIDEQSMRKFKLDFSQCSYLGEIYASVKGELELPDWCGENLDALWDAATGMIYTPAEITICRKVRRSELQSTVDEIISVFREAEEKYHEITVITED